jgi:hypothetical protein
MRIGTKTLAGAFAGVVVALVVLAIVAVSAIGFTQAPFTRSGEQATGLVQNSLGHEFHLDAASLSATWTFTRDVDVVVRFADGAAAFNGRDLEPGCYGGAAKPGDVLRFEDAHGVSFMAPRSDTACLPLP